MNPYSEMAQGPIILSAVEWLVLVAVVGLLIAIVKVLIGKQAKELDERVEEARKKAEASDKKVEEVRLNYLSRFDEIKDLQHQGKLEIITAIKDVELNIARNYMSKTECRFVEHPSQTPIGETS